MGKNTTEVVALDSNVKGLVVFRCTGIEFAFSGVGLSQGFAIDVEIANDKGLRQGADWSNAYYYYADPTF